MKFRFHPEALAEYEDAARYYLECQRGLELRFIECVERAIRQIVQTPERWRIFEADIRRCLTKVFPYAVLYTIENEHILIVAVMHCHREPGDWSRRIGEGESGPRD